MPRTIDMINDRWGNIYTTINDFFVRHPDERIFYQSSGALFKREGNVRLKPTSVFISQRGNLIISTKRIFFSNPTRARDRTKRNWDMSYLSILVVLSACSMVCAYLYRGVLVSGLCLLLFLPIVATSFVMIELTGLQNRECEFDIPFDKVCSKYMGTYRSISRNCPMFSCYDGENTYHFVGYRELNDSMMDSYNTILSQPKGRDRS